jgi:hypothetical protein
MTITRCPHCNQSDLELLVITEDVTVYGQCKSLDTLNTMCSSCGFIFTTYAQLVENDKSLNLLNYIARKEESNK